MINLNSLGTGGTGSNYPAAGLWWGCNYPGCTLTMLRSHAVHGRVIVHADLDCFYCQVEHVRLGIPTSTPLAVQQWDGIIAVNYSARKFGVKRGDRAEAALSKCPQIQLVHVETISSADSSLDGGGGGVEGGGEAVGAAPAGGAKAGAGAGAGGTRHAKGASKVSLERYRTASFAIMAIFQAHCRRVERASIDEAYLDLTEEAAKLCREAEEGGAEDVANAPETDLQGTAGHCVDPTSAFDRALLAGARLTAAMRLAVEQELGFTVSAGIASNKVLAKLASSINKPNKQTVVPAGAAGDMLDTVPVRNVRGLGGKLGEAVVSWSKAETASDLKRFSEQDLVGKFGFKTGVWLWRACRGMDDEPVTPNLKPKSLSVCKSFTPVRDDEAVLQWMRLLCGELAHRIGVDRKAWSRRATKLTLQIISLKSGGRTSHQGRGGEDAKKSATVTRSRTVDIPGGGEPPTAASLVSEAMSLFAKTEEALPCSRLALTAHDFSGLVSGRGSISSFMRALPPSPRDDLGGVGGGEGGAATGVPSKGRAEETMDLLSPRNISVEPRGSGSGSGATTGRGSEVKNTLRSAAGGETGKRSSPPLRPGEAECSKCGQVLRAGEDPQEHLDFHYAEGLQERYAREGDVARDMAAKMSDNGDLRSKRRRTERGGKGAKRPTKLPAGPRIDSFFKPA